MSAERRAFDEKFGPRDDEAKRQAIDEATYGEELKSQNLSPEQLFYIGLGHLQEYDYGRARVAFGAIPSSDRARNKIHPYLELAEAGASHTGLNGGAIWTENGWMGEKLRGAMESSLELRTKGEFVDEDFGVFETMVDKLMRDYGSRFGIAHPTSTDRAYSSFKSSIQ